MFNDFDIMIQSDELADLDGWSWFFEEESDEN